MFVLIGKVTSLAETFKGFPASETEGFREQMKELGQDAGTLLRVTFNFKKENNDDDQPYVRPVEPSKPDEKP